MGYMGLRHFNDSDMAADLASVAVSKMVNELRVGLKEKANEYNTNGPINVALFFEAFIVPLADEYKSYSDVWDLARDTKDLLEKHRNMSNKLRWDDSANKKDHIGSYDRMIKSLDSFLSE